MSHLVTAVRVKVQADMIGTANGNALMIVPRGLPVFVETSASRNMHKDGLPTASVLLKGDRVFHGATMSPLLRTDTHQTIIVAGVADVFFVDSKEGIDKQCIGTPVYCSGVAGKIGFTFSGTSLSDDPVGVFLQPTGVHTGTVLLQPFVPTPNPNPKISSSYKRSATDVAEAEGGLGPFTTDIKPFDTYAIPEESKISTITENEEDLAALVTEVRDLPGMSGKREEDSAVSRKWVGDFSDTAETLFSDNVNVLKAFRFAREFAGTTIASAERKNPPQYFDAVQEISERAIAILRTACENPLSRAERSLDILRAYTALIGSAYGAMVPDGAKIQFAARKDAKGDLERYDSPLTELHNQLWSESVKGRIEQLTDTVTNAISNEEDEADVIGTKLLGALDTANALVETFESEVSMLQTASSGEQKPESAESAYGAASGMASGPVFDDDVTRQLATSTRMMIQPLPKRERDLAPHARVVAYRECFKAAAEALAQGGGNADAVHDEAVAHAVASVVGPRVAAQAMVQLAGMTRADRGCFTKPEYHALAKACDEIIARDNEALVARAEDDTGRVNGLMTDHGVGACPSGATTQSLPLDVVTHLAADGTVPHLIAIDRALKAGLSGARPVMHVK